MWIGILVVSALVLLVLIGFFAMLCIASDPFMAIIDLAELLPDVKEWMKKYGALRGVTSAIIYSSAAFGTPLAAVFGVTVSLVKVIGG